MVVHVKGFIFSFLFPEKLVERSLIVNDHVQNILIGMHQIMFMCLISKHNWTVMRLCLGTALPQENWILCRINAYCLSLLRSSSTEFDVSRQSRRDISLRRGSTLHGWMDLWRSIYVALQWTATDNGVKIVNLIKPKWKEKIYTVMWDNCMKLLKFSCFINFIW